MKITTIKRKVTGSRYDNIEVVADVGNLDIDEDKEIILKETIKLDELCRELLDACYDSKENKRIEEEKKEEMVYKVEKLKEMIEDGKLKELPF